jgi:hypothetical protein
MAASPEIETFSGWLGHRALGNLRSRSLYSGPRMGLWSFSMSRLK